MKYFHLIWVGLWRKPARTMFMLVSTVAAFTLFGLLQGVDTDIRQAGSKLRLDVLLTGNSAGLPLPIAYYSQIASIKGITSVTYSSSFLGLYQSDTLASVIAIDPDQYFSQPQGLFTVSPEALAAFRKIRTAALVLRGPAQKLHWKIGDQVPIHGMNVQKRDGSPDWTFDIVGYFDMPDNPDNAVLTLLMSFAYLDAARASDVGTAQAYVETIADASQAQAIATAIDNLFLNSSVPTHTDTQRGTAQAQSSQLDDLEFLFYTVLGAAFATLLLLTSTALMQSYRERTRELAVLKTCGFSDMGVAGLLVSEAILLCLTAATAGVFLAKWAFDTAERSGKTTGVHFPPVLFVLATAAALVLALASSLAPAWQARRLSIIAALAAH